MKKVFSLILLTLMILVSCGKNSDIQNNKSGKYEKIVVLDPAAVEMIYLLGAEDKIVGVANLQNSKIWPEDKVEKLTSVGTFSNPSLEKIVALKPDLVLGSYHTSKELENSLIAQKIEVKKFQGNSVEQIFSNFREIAKLVGRSEEAEKIITEKEKQLAEIKNKIAKSNSTEKKGVFIVSPSPLTGFGNNTLPNDIMTIIGIQNIAGNSDMNAALTPEFILAENPDVILPMIPSPQA